MKLTSVQDTALRWGLSTKMVTQLCRENRVEGAEKISGVWLIPDTTLKPFDGREHIPATEPTGLGVVPAEMFEDRSRPAMTLKNHRFSFNTGFFKRFPDATRIDILCCEEMSELMIRPSQVAGATENAESNEASSPSSFQWCYIKDGKKTTKILQNRAVTTRIYAMAACPTDQSCRFLAYRVKSDPENTYRIRLSRYVGMPDLDFIYQREEEPSFSAFTPIV